VPDNNTIGGELMRRHLPFVIAALIAILALCCSSPTDPTEAIVLLQTTGTDFRIVDIHEVVVSMTIHNNTDRSIEMVDASSGGPFLEVYRDGAWRSAELGYRTDVPTFMDVPALGSGVTSYRLSPLVHLKTGMYRFRAVYWNSPEQEPRDAYSNVFRLIVEWPVAM
jgi:hypothetical protein